MEKQEFLELFEAATRAAKSARGDDKNSPAVSKCVDAMNRLKKAPESLACELVINHKYPQFGKSHGLFIHHKNRKIKSEAKLLYSLWLRHLYASGRKPSPCLDKDNSRPVVKKKKKRVETMISATGDSNRDKVREMLQKSLSKVANEVVEMKEMKERVVSCDSWIVAASVESAMFEKLGSFHGPQKAKYRSILFNMGDNSNPDLRRKVLIGQISGETLVTMEKEEMASDKIQLEIQNIKEKARFREENRMKSMMMFPSDQMNIT